MSFPWEVTRKRYSRPACSMTICRSPCSSAVLEKRRTESRPALLVSSAGGVAATRPFSAVPSFMSMRITLIYIAVNGQMRHRAETYRSKHWRHRPSGRVGCTHRGRFRAPDSPAQRIAGKLSCAASEITAHAYLTHGRERSELPGAGHQLRGLRTCSLPQNVFG